MGLDIVDNISYNMIMRKFVSVLGLILVLGVFLVLARPASAEVIFKPDGIFKARNLTDGQSAWSESVKGDNLDIIEFQVMIENNGDTKSSDVNVRVGFALDPGSTLENKIYVGIWSAPSVSDTVDIDVDSNVAQKLVYVPGKAVKYGGGCDGCAVSDNIARAGGTYVGVVDPGEAIEVRFQAQVTDRQPRVLASATTVTPTPKPTTTPASNNNGNSGGSSGGVGGAAVADTTPETGFIDPFWLRTLVWLTVGGAGIGLRQMARKLSTIEA